MLKVSKYNNNWRIGIQETLEFKTKEEFQKELNALIEMKSRHGELTKNKTEEKTK